MIPNRSAYLTIRLNIAQTTVGKGFILLITVFEKKDITRDTAKLETYRFSIDEGFTCPLAVLSLIGNRFRVARENIT